MLGECLLSGLAEEINRRGEACWAKGKWVPQVLNCERTGERGDRGSLRCELGIAGRVWAWVRKGRQSKRCKAVITLLPHMTAWPDPPMHCEHTHYPKVSWEPDLLNHRAVPLKKPWEILWNSFKWQLCLEILLEGFGGGIFFFWYRCCLKHIWGYTE